MFSLFVLFSAFVLCNILVDILEGFEFCHLLSPFFFFSRAQCPLQTLLTEYVSCKQSSQSFAVEIYFLF